MPTVETLEQFAFSNQTDIPSLPPDRWAWVSTDYPHFGTKWVFGDRFVIEMLGAGHDVLWDPLTGRGRRITVAQSETMFHARGNHMVDLNMYGPRVATSGGLYLTQSVTPGETFHCHPNLSITYVVTDRDGGSARTSLFILRNPHPTPITYPVCSEGNLPDHETTALAFDAVAMDWAMLPDGTALGFPQSLPSDGSQGCILRLDASFRQREYIPGCPVQIDESLINAGFAGPNGGSPAFRAKIVEPVYQAAIKALDQ